MLTRKSFQEMSRNFNQWCQYPAVRYKILYHFLDVPYDHEELAQLRPEFLSSDIVQQIYEAQLPDGSWGPLFGKDYSCKNAFPTTEVAIDRSLYIGLTIEDKDMLFMALDYLEYFLRGESKQKLYDKNERAIPWQMCEIAKNVERIQPYNPLCDRLWEEWNYIASCAFASGEYSHECDKVAQHELLSTREERLVPLPINFLLARPDKISRKLEKSMLNYYGRKAHDHGFFWDKSLNQFPENFVYEKTRRWFHTIKYINQFRDTKEYLQSAIEWLMDNQNQDGLWDYGPQTKDPWGYFGYFSTNRNYKYNRVVDCTIEVLNIMKVYLDHNEID
jgi:hypothetical protein